jgi:hypothetical protein
MFMTLEKMRPANSKLFAEETLILGRKLGTIERLSTNPRTCETSNKNLDLCWCCLHSVTAFLEGGSKARTPLGTRWVGAAMENMERIFAG